MRLSLFSIAAIVLIVFAIVASAGAALTFLGVAWTTWLCAAILSWFVGHTLEDISV